jgi:hypothetical protein
LLSSRARLRASIGKILEPAEGETSDSRVKAANRGGDAARGTSVRFNDLGPNGLWGNLGFQSRVLRHSQRFLKKLNDKMTD